MPEIERFSMAGKLPLFRILLISCVLVIISAIWLLNDGGKPSKPSHDVSPTHSEQLPANASTALSLSDNDADEPTRKIIRQTELASASRLQALDPNTLKLSREAIALFEFPPEKIEAINSYLEAFTRKLFAEERSRAFVEVSSESGEVIVVPSFDRRPFYDELKHSLSQVAENSVARLMIERISHDIRLGCVTSEIRVSFEDDPNGNATVNFIRKVLAEAAHDPDIPLNSPGGKALSPFDTTIKVRTRSPSGNVGDPRLRHLIDAAEQLPKRNK